MDRRSVLALVAGAGSLCAGAGCYQTMAENSIALVVRNETSDEQRVHVVTGGRMTPAHPDPPEGKTATRVGIDEVTLDRTVTLPAGDERRFEDVATTTDGPRYLGITVDVEGGPSLRRPVRVGPTARGTVVTASIDADDVTLGVSE